MSTKIVSQALEAIADTTLPAALTTSASGLLKFLPLISSGATTAAARLAGGATTVATAAVNAAARLQGPGSRLSLASSIGQPGAAILLERDDGPAARKVRELADTLRATEPLEVVATGSPASHRPVEMEGDEAPGALIEDWRPGRSVSHVRGSAGSLGVLVDFEIGRGTGKKRVRGFTSASHVLSLVPDAKAGEVVLSPGVPDVNRDPGTYGIGELRSWCALLHHTQASDETNGQDIAFVELNAQQQATLPSANLVPDPAQPDDRQITLARIASRTDIEQLAPSSPVFMVGRTSGFRKGLLHSRVGPTPINLPDRRTYIYSNLYFVQPADVGRGFSDNGDSGAAVYTGSGMLIGFVVAQAKGGTWIQLAEPCLAFAKATLIK